MFASTPIFDALAEKLLGRETDFVPQWLTVRRNGYSESPPAGWARHRLPRSALHSCDVPGGVHRMPSTD